MGNAIVAAAEKYLGTAYCWGGGGNKGPTTTGTSLTEYNGPAGESGCTPGQTPAFDCSGLVKYAVYSATQISLGHTVPDEEDGITTSGPDVAPQLIANPATNNFSSVQAGDILIFADSSGSLIHDGIYMGLVSGKPYFINAYDYKNDFDNGPNNEYWGVTEMPVSWETTGPDPLTLVEAVRYSGTSTSSSGGGGSSSPAYVTNGDSNRVSVIDTATNKVTATIPVGFSPTGVVVTPNGKAVYVTNYSGKTVSVIDAATNKVIATVAVGGTPYGMAVTPNGEEIYVTNLTGVVSVLSTATNKVTATIAVGADSAGVAVTPNGKAVYIASIANGTVSVISTATNKVTASIAVGGFYDYLYAMATTPNGKAVYVINPDADAVSMISTATNKVTATVALANGTLWGGINPTGVAISPNGKAVYMINLGTVSVISTATNKVTATVALANGGNAVAVTPNGKAVYVNGVGTVSVISTATNKVTATVAVRGGVGAIALAP